MVPSLVGVLVVVCSVVLAVNIDLEWPARALTQLVMIALATAVSGALIAWNGRGLSNVARAVSLTVLVAGVAASIVAAASWSEHGDLTQGQTITTAVMYAIGIALFGSTVGGIGAVLASRFRRR